jgi:hypothetical protein
MVLLLALAAPAAAARADSYDGHWRGSADALTKIYRTPGTPVCSTMDLDLSVVGDRFTAVANLLRFRKAPRPLTLEFSGSVSETGLVERTDKTGMNQPLHAGQISGDVMTIGFEGIGCKYDFNLRRE